jgi:hypothetical protein
MKRITRTSGAVFAGVLSVLIVTSLALVIGKGSDPAEPRKSDRSSDTVQTIIIDKAVGETFTPATDEQIAANRDEVLSSAQAWARFSPDGAAPPPGAIVKTCGSACHATC